MSDKGYKKRIEQSRCWLKDALISLMQEVPYSEITTGMISSKADVARCTFYRHYESKDALLQECCKDQFNNLFTRMSKEDVNTFHGAGLGYFDYWSEHRDFLLLLKRNNLFHFFTEKHDLYMYEVSMKLKPENVREDVKDYSVKTVYHFFCLMSAMLGILKHWINAGCNESSEELAQYYVSFITEGYESDADCRYYEENHAYPYNPCYITPGI